jgi:glutathione S-transferase
VPLAEVKPLSPSGFVPILQVPSLSLTINDSLAISEFLAESHPSLPLWPCDAYLRALARSAACEMHSGFSTLRNTFDSNFVAHFTGPIPVTEAARKEIERMLEVWGQARQKTVARLDLLGKRDEDEGFLFGGFGIADAFFWPVLWVSGDSKRR